MAAARKPRQQPYYRGYEDEDQGYCDCGRCGYAPPKQHMADYDRQAQRAAVQRRLREVARRQQREQQAEEEAKEHQRILEATRRQRLAAQRRVAQEQAQAHVQAQAQTQGIPRTASTATSSEAQGQQVQAAHRYHATRAAATAEHAPGAHQDKRLPAAPPPKRHRPRFHTSKGEAVELVEIDEGFRLPQHRRLAENSLFVLEEITTGPVATTSA